MNKEGRNQISNIVRQLELLSKNITTDNLGKTVELLEDCISEIDDLESEEREKFDNLSEGLQASDRGFALEEAADNLSDAKSSLEPIDNTNKPEDVASSIESAIESLEMAKG